MMMFAATISLKFRKVPKVSIFKVTNPLTTHPTPARHPKDSRKTLAANLTPLLQ